MMRNSFRRGKVFLLTLLFLSVALIEPVSGERNVVSPPFPPQLSERSVKEGMALFRSERYGELSLFLLRHPFPESMKDFERYLTGLAAFEQGDLPKGLKEVKELQKDYRDSFFTKYLSVDGAYHLFLKGSWEEGERFLRGVTKQPFAYLEGSRFLLARGRLLMHRGKLDEGAKSLLACVTRFPGTGPSLEGAKILLPYLLKEGGEGKAKLARTLGESLTGEGNYMDAVRLLSFWRERATGEERRAIDISLANGLRKANRYSEAISVLMEKGKGIPPSLEGKKKFFAALFTWYMGKGKKAVRMFTSLLAEFPGTKASFRSAYNLGRMFEERGDYTRARRYYLQASKGSRSRIFRESSFRLGLSLFLAGEYKEAERVFGKNGKIFRNGEEHYRNLFFRGYSLEKQGDRKGARSVYESITRGGVGGLYYFMSLMKLDDFPGWGFYGAFPLRKVTSTALLKVMEEEPGLGEMDRRRVKRALLFQKLGAFSFSMEELNDSSFPAFLRKVPKKIRRAFISYGSGNYREGIVSSPSQGSGKIPSFLPSVENIKYPFLPFIRKSHSSLPDPFLIHSIIRQESRFDHSVISSAGAIGLGQIMPRTGEKIAKRLGVDPYRVEMLFDPFVNVSFSRSYLGGLITRFDGDLIVASAAYNGGERAVRRWLKKYGSDPYLFPDRISFEETRMYVRKVFSNYLAYLKIYGRGWGE